MEIYSIYFRLLAASQVLLFLVLFVFSDNPKFVRWIGTFLVLGILGYLLNAVFTDGLMWILLMPVWFFSELIPAFLALFVWILFEEGRPVPQSLFAALGMNVLLVAFMQFQVLEGRSLNEVTLLAYGFKATWILVAIFTLLSGREMDLVEDRQKLRLVFVSAVAAITLGVVVTEIVFQLEVPLWVEGPGMLVIFLAALAINAAFIRTNSGMRLVGARRSVPVENDDPVIEELLARMSEERLYADHDIRVSTLAATLNVPEYQLRRKINQSLGYRNFNQFVNKYRIEEAGFRLLEEQKAPVLTIALDVGFRSLSSFNSAFQSKFGCSPTEYRRRKLPNS